MGASSNSSSTPIEAPNSLLSTGVLKLTDLVCEGPIKGFVVQSGAYGSDPLTSTYYDNVPVRNLDGSYNFNISGQGFSFYYTLGTTDQTAMSGFDKVENTIPLSSNTQVINPPIGAGNQKNVTATFNTSMYPDADSIKITIRIPTLYTQSSDGNINPYSISYAIDISLNNGAFVQFDSLTIFGKCTSPYLHTTSYVLPKGVTSSSKYQWTVRVRRTSQDIFSAATPNSLYVDSIAVVSSSSFVYPNSVLVGTFIAADQFSSIPTRAYLIDGLLMSVPVGYTPTTYNTDGTITPAVYPSVWMGDFQTGIWTDNPAWIFNDLLTNSRYGLGDYIQTSNVDKWSLYQISQYCDEMVDNGLGDGGLEPRFTFNTSIQTSDDAYNVLLNMSSVFRGMLYYANGTIQATQTSDKTSVYAYTNANVLNGAFSYADTAKSTRSTVALVKWTDPYNLYRENVEYIEDSEGIARYGYIERQAGAFACTSRGQAYRLGNWLLQSEKLLTETVSFQVGLEGIYIRPGDVFNIFDNFRSNRNQGGRIVSYDTGRRTIQLDRSVPIEPGLNYSFTAIVPKATLDSPNGVPDSSYDNLIRNSQIEVIGVTNGPTSGTSTITLNNAFSTGLFIGSPWILSVSGGGNILNNAGLYQCLATTETQPGIIDVLALQYNTGINTLIERNYTVVNNPVNSGDFTPILPPSGLIVSPVTGLFSNNDFYFYLQLNWTDTPSTNLAYYRVSGQKFGGTWENFSNPTANAVVYNTATTGQTNFKVAAVSNGGVVSSFISGSYVIPDTNPLGNKPLSGMYLTTAADATYLNAQGFATGYLNTNPRFNWVIPQDVNGNQYAQAQFITGFRFRALDFNTNADLIVPYPAVPFNASSYQLSGGTFTSMAGGAHRGFKAYVEILDQFGNVSSGASLSVNNPAPAAPVDSGFAPGAGNFTYAITPNPQDLDISGVYFWYDNTSTLIPTFANANYKSSNLAGIVNNGYSNSYNVWFALSDTFSISGSTIYGPIFIDALSGLSGISTQINVIRNALGDLGTDLANEMSRANDQAAGLIQDAAVLGTRITNETILRTTGDYQLAQQINTLSATITGVSGYATTSALLLEQTARVSGDTALASNITILQANVSNATGVINSNVSSNSIAIANTSGALSSQINSLSASVTNATGTINSSITGEQYARATADTALAGSITTLNATVTGISATTTILANAYVISGRAVSTYGFQLDANGKVISMQAIAASGGSQPTVGVIVFGGADLQSSDYTPNVTGWTIKANGQGEIGSWVIRDSLVINYEGAPSFSPSNTSFATGLTINVNASSGATVRYTMDGSPVNSSSSVWSGPVLISGTTLFRAKTYQGNRTSDEVIAIYNTTGLAGTAPVYKAATPGIGSQSLSDGDWFMNTYNSTPGGTIYYGVGALNSTTPPSIATAYSSPVTVSCGTNSVDFKIFYAKSVVPGFLDSDVATVKVFGFAGV